jgi:hypothetical protein
VHITSFLGEITNVDEQKRTFEARLTDSKNETLVSSFSFDDISNESEKDYLTPGVLFFLRMGKESTGSTGGTTRNFFELVLRKTTLSRAENVIAEKDEQLLKAKFANV